MDREQMDQLMREIFEGVEVQIGLRQQGRPEGRVGLSTARYGIAARFLGQLVRGTPVIFLV